MDTSPKLLPLSLRATALSAESGHENVPLPGHMDGVDESTWLDVIQKMDEVYTRLVNDEVELEKKNAELEQSQKFIFSVLSAMSDVLVVCDERGLIEQANAALCELVGRSEADLKGTPLAALLAEADSVTLATEAMATVDATYMADGMELNFLDRQGQPVPVDTNVTPRVSGHGRRMGTVWVGRPTAELKRAYREMRTAHEALKRTQQQLLHSEKMASLGQLVAGVAHELNNPISFVLGNVHALRKYCHRLQRYMDGVHAHQPEVDLVTLRRQLNIDHLLADLPSLIDGTMEGAQRTADIVHGLKRFSAVDSGEFAPVNVMDVVERAIHWVQKGRSTHMAVDWQPGPVCMVMGSAGQLQQVVMNLLQNAFDALETSGRAAPCVSVSVTAESGTVALRVHDNGAGIAPEHLLRIFDPFFTTKPVGKGTGLGLSISYGIAEQHGGRLSGLNAEQGGAEFVLTLPALGGVRRS